MTVLLPGRASRLSPPGAGDWPNPDMLGHRWDTVSEPFTQTPVVLLVELETRAQA